MTSHCEGKNTKSYSIPIFQVWQQVSHQPPDLLRGSQQAGWHPKYRELGEEGDMSELLLWLWWSPSGVKAPQHLSDERGEAGGAGWGEGGGSKAGPWPQCWAQQLSPGHSQSNHLPPLSTIRTSDRSEGVSAETTHFTQRMSLSPQPQCSGGVNNTTLF